MAIAQEWQQREGEPTEPRRIGSRSSDDRRDASERTHDRLANGLGWFSIGLGVAEVSAPGSVARLIGLRDEDRSRKLLRAYGLREIASGIGILTQPNPAGWIWSRVAGDVLDLASLSRAMKSNDAMRGRAAIAATAVLGITVLDAYCAQQARRSAEQDRGREDRAVRVKKSILVNRSPDDVYQFWRDFQNLSRFMSHIESVRLIDDRRSHWTAKGPAGKTVEWEAEILEDRPNELIAWRSLEESDVQHFGSVRFEHAPAGRGTFVNVEMQYDPPGGPIGARIARLFGGDPGLEIARDLRSVKQVMEIGEVVRSDASIHPGIHPAQPPE